MKRLVLTLFNVLMYVSAIFGQVLLTDKTLRADYIFSGNSGCYNISLDELSSYSGWSGRSVNMDRVFQQGNGQIRMTDAASGKLLYINSFSTLFQEWLCTEEAVNVSKSFENVFLLPMPSEKVDVTVELYDTHNKVTASLTHRVDPKDILIRPIVNEVPEYTYIWKGGTPAECIDVVILPEGYTSSEMELFMKDAALAVESIFSHSPFGDFKDRFNFLAVQLPSRESGVSIPHEGIWKDTALKSHFDTFYSNRYLTTLRLGQMHDLLAGVPYEHIIILANTDNYGGGGIFNSYTLTTAHHRDFAPVVVHEFGHSFGGLADEYYYDDQYENYYNSETEPWERNITTLVDFESKWKDMIEPATVIPTPMPVANPNLVNSENEDAVRALPSVGLYEGGGYMSKGVWRGSFDCRMHTNKCNGFCPVCRNILERIIRFYTEDLGGCQIDVSE